jgi:hypothetical protein
MAFIFSRIPDDLSNVITFVTHNISKEVSKNELNNGQIKEEAEGGKY